ncbi:MAG: OmpA family protein [Alphaproteobacteria bacterium]|nr:OmpA family protein [Alphaproteobacteria bacterium]
MPTLLSLLLSPAWAQDTFNAWNFVPSAQDGDLRDPVTVTRPGQVVANEWYVAGIAGFAKSPLRVVEVTGDTETRTAALDNVVSVDLVGGFAPTDRIRLDLAVPAFLTSRGEAGTAGPALGDLRASALLVPFTFGDDGEGGVGLRPWIGLPTGASARYLGSRRISGGGTLSATLPEGPWTFTGEAGLAFNGAVDALNIQGSDLIGLGAGVGRLITDDIGMTLEAHLKVPLSPNDQPFRETPGEALLSLRHRQESGGHVVGGLGTSITPGAGAARFRIFVGGGFGRIDRVPPDLDGDGMIAADDLCPDEPETVNGYKDEDGCPDQLADLKATAVWNGAPYDGPVDFLGKIGTFEQAVKGSKAFELKQRMPGEAWSLHAETACLAGDGDITLAEGENALQVELIGGQTPITFAVVDPSGKAIENARLTFVEQVEGCGVTEPKQVLENGTRVIELWQGPHKVTATADKFGTAAVEVQVTEGPETVTIQLAPTKATLEGGEIKILDKVHFDANSATIKPLSYELLDEVAAIIIANENIKLLEVQGHADERGSSTFNLELSKKRAEAVRQYLVNNGVAGERLVIQGYGETQPIVPGSTEAAWAENRRVQFLIRETTDAPE